MFQHLLDQNITLFIHHLQEVSEDREVKRWGQHFASTAPLFSCTVMCGRQIMKSTQFSFLKYVDSVFLKGLLRTAVKIIFGISVMSGKLYKEQQTFNGTSQYV